MVYIISVMYFLLQVGFMLFCYKRQKCKQFRLLTYIEESFRSFRFLRITPVHHHWIQIAILAFRVKVFSVTTPTNCRSVRPLQINTQDCGLVILNRWILYTWVNCIWNLLWISSLSYIVIKESVLTAQ
jgi:hypothetical protein